MEKYNCNVTNKKLFITDLDSTALGGGFLPYDRFPDHFSDFLDDLTQDGWDWAINTTWDPEGQWALVQRSKVKSRPRFLIGEFGRQLVEVEHNELRRISPYTDENNARVEHLCKHKILPFLWKLSLRFSPKQIFYYGHLSSLYYADSDWAAINEFIAAETDPELYIRRNENKLEIRPAFLHKGLPMPLINETFGYSPERIICAGDSSADMAMMESKFSKWYLAPGNAEPEVKEYIQSHNGCIGKQNFAWGVIEAFQSLSAKNRSWK